MAGKHDVERDKREQEGKADCGRCLRHAPRLPFHHQLDAGGRWIGGNDCVHCLHGGAEGHTGRAVGEHRDLAGAVLAVDLHRAGADPWIGYLAQINKASLKASGLQNGHRIWRLALCLFQPDPDVMAPPALLEGPGFHPAEENPGRVRQVACRYAEIGSTRAIDAELQFGPAAFVTGANVGEFGARFHRRRQPGRIGFGFGQIATHDNLFDSGLTDATTRNPWDFGGNNLGCLGKCLPQRDARLIHDHHLVGRPSLLGRDCDIEFQLVAALAAAGSHRDEHEFDIVNSAQRRIGACCRSARPCDAGSLRQLDRGKKLAAVG